MGKWLSSKEMIYGHNHSKKVLARHSHIRTTERYLQSTDDRKVEAIRSLQFGV